MENKFLTSDKNPKANNIVSKKKKNAVIMGRVTWESIPSRFRPLADRENIIISRTMAGKKDFDCASCKIVKNLDEALEYAKNFREIFVIGGAQLYKSCFEHPDLQYIYHTRVDNNYNCDRFVFLPAHYCRDKELVRGEYTPKGKEKDRVKIMFHTIRYKT